MPDANNPNPPKPAPAKPAKRSFQAPKGTRDLYPDDANLRRFITEAWRNASIRHGFEEIDGPTFEDAELYKVKSGDGILAEMFGVFSGKSPEDVEAVRDPSRGPPYVLRPEFTPTLARMYAARAAQLSKPTKWFTAGPFFRAERPQRGRLREFLQWNVDFIGLPGLGEGKPTDDQLAESKARADAECIACCVDLLRSLGFTPKNVRVKFYSRMSWVAWMQDEGVPPELVQPTFMLLDSRTKMSEDVLRQRCAEIGLPPRIASQVILGSSMGVSWDLTKGHPSLLGLFRPMQPLLDALIDLGVAEWCEIDSSIVRGLAYYTGMVFEVIADGERAVAGGGRYDNLIELFGGPPTPAVGFGMGDVVLTNLLRDKGLLPERKALLDKLSQTPAPLRPDAFVLTADESLDPLVRGLVADLRRGVESSHSLHARHSYKSTRNVGKLLKEAAAQHARFAVIIETATTATIKPLDAGEQFQCPLSEVPARLSSLLHP